MRLLRVHKFVQLVLFLVPSLVHVQTATNANNDESTPAPSVGHDYLHFTSETVGQGSGSFSARIQSPV